MRGHGTQMWMCVAMVVIALVLVAATGSGLYILPAVGCVLMMGAMMWMVMGAMGGRGGPSDRGRDGDRVHGLELRHRAGAGRRWRRRA